MPATRTTSTRGSDLAPAAKPGPDVYIGLLVISLIAQVVAALFLYLDFKDYPDKVPSPPKLQAVGGAAPAATPAAAPPAATPPAATPPGGPPAAAPPGGQAPAAPAPAAPAPAGQAPAANPPMPK
jgi:hypothetical protein